MQNLIFTFLSICFVQANLILTPKEHNLFTFEFGSFAQEHNLDNLAKIGDLILFKTNTKNYNKYKSTFDQIFDVEQEQIYTINPIKSETEKETENLVYIPESDGSFSMLKLSDEPVPWHLDRISKRNLPLDGSYAYSLPGSCHKNSNVEIETVVVDTGVQSHIEFGDNQPMFLENFSGDNVNEDCNSHGTFCSSQIGGLKAGVCKSAKLFAVKVLTCEGSGSTSGVIAGMNYVFNRHIEKEKENPKLRTIMSMSLGGGKSLAMNRAVERMVKMSDTFYIVVASGNEGQLAENTSPASARGILTANAMNKNDERAYFSNYGSCTDIYSPGVDNYGAILNNKYAVESGTSFSTPILAGIMNHVLDENPHLNMKQLKEKILSDATKDTIKGNKKNTPNLMVYLKRNDD
jgi:hypothetical protein